MPNESRPPAPGIVVLERVPDGLLDGLPIADQRAVSEIVGKAIRLHRYDADGRAELEFVDADGVIHFIYVSPDAIRSLAPGLCP